MHAVIYAVPDAYPLSGAFAFSTILMVSLPLPPVLLLLLPSAVITWMMATAMTSVGHHRSWLVWCGADDNFDEFSAETLAAIDNELQQIKLALLQRFPQLDLSSVFPIGQVCQSQTIGNLKRHE